MLYLLAGLFCFSFNCFASACFSVIVLRYLINKAVTSFLCLSLSRFSSIILPAACTARFAISSLSEFSAPTFSLSISPFACAYHPGSIVFCLADKLIPYLFSKLFAFGYYFPCDSSSAFASIALFSARIFSASCFRYSAFSTESFNALFSIVKRFEQRLPCELLKYKKENDKY